MTTTQTTKARINRQIHNLGIYHPEIPLDDIFAIVRYHAGRIVQEDGTEWSGILCGDDGSARFEIAGKNFPLFLTWHKMNSGNYEIVAYVS